MVTQLHVVGPSGRRASAQLDEFGHDLIVTDTCSASYVLVSVSKNVGKSQSTRSSAPDNDVIAPGAVLGLCGCRDDVVDDAQQQRHLLRVTLLNIL